MKKVAYCAVAAMVLTACTQQHAAQVLNKGNQFFGKIDMPSDMALKMPQSPTIAAKYRSDQPEFSTAAAVPSVVAAPLEEPTAQLAAAPSATVKAVDAQPVKMANSKVVSYVALKASTMPSPRTLPTVSVAEKTDLVPTINQATGQKPTFMWPVEGKVISAFGTKPNGLINDGINIAADEGKPIWAAAAGEVAYAGNELKGYGNMLILRHANGWMTAYAHASDMILQKGDKVAQGDLIGYVGKSGEVPVAQLHFGVRQGKQAINPEELLPRRVASAK